MSTPIHVRRTGHHTRIGCAVLGVATLAVAAMPVAAQGEPSGAVASPTAAVGSPSTRSSSSPGPSPVRLPPPHAAFDYQIGGDYELPAGVELVSRDWFIGAAPDGVYAICYVNAFQTQDDEEDLDRPDERSNWPSDLVLGELGDDPDWGGEYLIDISTDVRRQEAAVWIDGMVRPCRDKGFDAVEFDNLDSWTRFDETPLESQVPFGREDAIAYAELLADMAHGYGLAAAQKNTVELPAAISRDRIGFDFAIAEECGRWDECQAYRDVFGDHVIVIEYRVIDFEKTCREHGDALSVVFRDVLVTTPGSPTYQYAHCPEAGQP